MKYFKIAFFILVYSLIPLSLTAQYSDDEETFFSYERFYLKAAVLKDVSKSANVRSDVKAFMSNFSDGIDAIRAGDTKKAKNKLLRARAVWPEYFGPDFLLARVSEDMGDYDLSARFYKSYLDKLKALSEGRYRISESLIRGMTPYGIEKFSDANTFVKYRLKDYYGINVSTVRPFYTIPGVFKIFIIIVMLGSGYAIGSYVVIPDIRRRWRLNNPPEGSWTCGRCGTYNSDIRKACEKCGEKTTKNRRL